MKFADRAVFPPMPQTLFDVFWHLILHLEQTWIYAEEKMASNDIDNMSRAAEATFNSIKTIRLCKSIHCCIVVRSVVEYKESNVVHDLKVINNLADPIGDVDSCV